MASELLPAERLALTVARNQASRGCSVPSNTAMVLVLAVDRLTGKHDWTQEDHGEVSGRE